MTCTMNNKTILTILTVMAIAAFVMYPINDAEAAKTRACTTNQSPKGVESVSTTEVWVANDGGTLQKFTALSTGCTVTSYTVGGDPHFIDRSSSDKITFSEHTADKITYFDPSASTQQECTGTAINDPDDVESDTSSAQYSTGYASGKLVKTVKGASSCTVTSWTVATGANPSGLDKSTDVNGFLIVDQQGNDLYEFDKSTNTMTLCESFTSKPWYVTDDSTNDKAWITFGASKVIRSVSTSCNGSIFTSSLTGIPSVNWPFDVAVRSGADKVIVTMSDNAKIGIYDISADTWTFDDWSTECSGCTGFGIDAIYSTGDYYAALRGTSTSKIVKGTS